MAPSGPLGSRDLTHLTEKHIRRVVEQQLLAVRRISPHPGLDHLRADLMGIVDAAAHQFLADRLVRMAVGASVSDADGRAIRQADAP